MVSSSSRSQRQARSGENAPARGAPQGAPTTSSSSWMTSGAVSQQRRNAFARSSIRGMPGLAFMISVTARARYMVMLGTCLRKFSFRRT